LPQLLHAGDRVWSDSAYTGQIEIIKKHAPNAWISSPQSTRNNRLSKAEKAKNTTDRRCAPKSSNAFLIIKRIFGFTKVRYRGLMKNANRLLMSTCCLGHSCYMVRRRLLRLHGIRASVTQNECRNEL